MTYFQSFESSTGSVCPKSWSRQDRSALLYGAVFEHAPSPTYSLSFVQSVLAHAQYCQLADLYVPTLSQSMPNTANFFVKVMTQHG
jgi:hypothetical protein